MRLFALIVLLIFVVVQPAVAQDSGPLDDCIIILGDSIPAGYAVTEVPGFGFPVIVTRPFAHVLDGIYHERNLIHLGIYDMSVGASGLGDSADVAYRTTSQYQIALTRRCHFALIFPWINDLPESSDPLLAQAHIGRLAELGSDIHNASPGTHLVYLDYYRVVTTELGERVYGSTISAPVIGMMNASIQSACTPSGPIGRLGNVSCLHIEPHLLPLDDVLVRTMTQQQFLMGNVRVVDASQRSWFDTYWAENPGASIAIDGVHLNDEGKRRLAEAVQTHMETVNPVAFQPPGGF